ADLRVFMFMPLLVPPLTPVSRLPSLFGAGLSAAAPRECIRRDGRPPLRRDPRAGAERRAVRVGGTRGGVWRERREGARGTRAGVADLLAAGPAAHWRRA
ncbi:unnamed protein product, partial [Prorocentrum cordatum]